MKGVWAPSFHDYDLKTDPNSVFDIDSDNSQVVTHQISEFDDGWTYIFSTEILIS